MNLYDMKTFIQIQSVMVAMFGSLLWLVCMYLYLCLYIYIYTTSFTLNSDKALVLDYTSISMLR